jgi:cobalt-zinc-cadmium efflux system outer membrane protein
MARRLFPLLFGLLVSGCLYHARERTDEAVCALAAKPYDLQPTAESSPIAPGKESEPKTEPKKAVQAAVDVQTTALLETANQAQPGTGQKPRLEPKIPPEVPGSETPLLKPLPKDPIARQREMEKLYPELPPLPEEPVAKPGPDGKPYTLSMLHQIAATNSAKLKQAVSDVEAARGNWIQARAYPNPTVGLSVQPSNDGSTSGVWGPFIDQKILVGGKLKLGSAAAEMDYENAKLALRRARSDLATSVRNAYFAVLVAKETMRVNRALAEFTDAIYRLHVTGQLGAGQAALYEPAVLRSQAYTTRLAYKQSIQSYIYAWNELVAIIDLRHLPLSEIAGRVDAFIPYFDYDKALAHVLTNHTDVLTARNVLEKARYNLKLAQVTPVPDFDFNISLLKEFALPPKQIIPTATIGFPLPIWDQNTGAIMATEAALVRASEEPHRAETNLTNLLATAYAGYKQNLDALEYYRRYILRDQVQYYRGVFDRRQVDINAQFNDLVTAQQTLSSSVSTYLGILTSLWSSVVSVADLLETDDLFQFASPKELPALDLDRLAAWPCCHTCPPAGDACATPTRTPAPKPVLKKEE